MRSLKLWAVIPIVFLALLFACSANARVTVFAWDAAPSWPPGTTIELEANGATATGITTTQYALDVPVQPGEVINARARAIPPAGYECGDPLEPCQPSDWATLVQTLPAIPIGLWARWTHEGGSVMADPVFQTLGTLDYRDSSTTNSLSTVITNVAVGDLLLAFVQRNGESNITWVASSSPSLTFTKLGTIQSGIGFNQGVWGAIATSAAASMTITASFSNSEGWGSMYSARWSNGPASITPSQSTVHSSLQSSTTNRTNSNISPTARVLLVACGTDWDFYRTHTAATNWTKRVDSQTFGTDSTTMFLHSRIADAGTYPSGNYATVNSADKYMSGVFAFPVQAGGGPQALAGDAATVASATGAVQMVIPVASTSASVATAAGSLSIALPLQAAASVIASATGGVALQLSMAGSALSEVLASGALGLTMPLAGDAASEATAAGDLTTGGEADLSGDALAQATATGQITLSMALSGAAISEALAAAGITLESALAAQAVAQAAGVADAGMDLPLSGGAQGQQTATGDLTALAEGALAGNAAAIISVSGLFGMTIPIAGDAQVLATTGGSLGMNMAVAGDASAVMLSNGNLQISLGIPLEAAALAVATAGGSLSMTIPLDAVALAQATATGTLSGGAESYVAYPPRTWTPGFIPRVWEPSAMNRTWMASASNRVWH